MQFSDIVAQENAKQQLMSAAQSGHIPHALMLTGNEGCGALPLAIAFAQHLLTDQQGESARLMAEKLQHPDLHFVFPIYKKNKAPKATYCDDFIDAWRQTNLSTPYFGYSEWMQACGADKQQLVIYADESDAISRKLSLKSSQGGYKVCIIWLPEKMHETCANKLLKLLEEPPAMTLFLMVCERPELLLSTIRSRVQTIELPPLRNTEIETTLIQRHGILPAEAQHIAQAAEGNLVHALRTITDSGDEQYFFEKFVELMRLSYMRRVKEMKLWSEEIADLGRERQKNFLAYCQRMVRENFIHNFHRPELNYMSENEASFAVKFAPYINERNVIGIMNEISLAQRDIAQNAMARILFFDFALKMIVLIKNR